MSTFRSKGKIKFDYLKSIVVSLIIPLGYLWLWYFSFPSTINELLLLTHRTKITSGIITKANQVEDYIEMYEGRKTEKTLDFNFEYTFKIPSGKVITSYGSEVGALPDILSDVNSNPYPVEVEYLPNNPETNRVKASWTGEKSLFQWFRRKVIIGLLVFLFFCYLGFKVYKYSKKSYEVEISEYNKFVQDYLNKKAT